MLFNSHEFIFAFLPLVLSAGTPPPADGAAGLPDTGIMVLLRLVGLAILAIDAVVDHHRLRGRALLDLATDDERRRRGCWLRRSRSTWRSSDTSSTPASSSPR